MNGDITLIKEGIVVHGCNAQGVMGAGLAVKIKKTYPSAFQAYREKYENHGLRAGEVIFVPITDELIIANAITQTYYGRNRGKLVIDEAVSECFAKVAALAKERGMKVWYPQIGCNLGGGVWSDIYPLIHEQLKDVDHELCHLPTPKVGSFRA